MGYRCFRWGETPAIPSRRTRKWWKTRQTPACLEHFPSGWGTSARVCAGLRGALPRPLSRDHRRETSEETLPWASGPPRGLPGRTPHFGHGGGRKGGQAAPVGGLSSPPSPGSSRRVNPGGSEAGAPGSCSLPTALLPPPAETRHRDGPAQPLCGAAPVSGGAGSRPAMPRPR